MQIWVKDLAPSVGRSSSLPMGNNTSSPNEESGHIMEEPPKESTPTPCTDSFPTPRLLTKEISSDPVSNYQTPISENLSSEPSVSMSSNLPVAEIGKQPNEGSVTTHPVLAPRRSSRIVKPTRRLINEI